MADENKRRPAPRWAAFLFVLAALLLGGYQALTHPKSPVPRAWNPLAPLVVTDPETPLTAWKLRRTASDPVACLVALGDAVGGEMLPPLVVDENCGIENRVRVSRVGQSTIAPIETACAVALRMVLWEHHGLRPAAQEFMGTDLTEIRQIGSYNCRRMRTPNGGSGRWSTHATGEAIDITGFGFANGQSLTLIEDWDGDPSAAAFLRAARDSACDWFATTLGPDFNRLHADHFHLQSRGWGTCR